MVGRRRPALGVERIATGIRSGSASPFTAGGLVQASPITGLDRTDARRRDLIPPTPTGGRYIPVFTIGGPVEARDYDTPLHNVTGADLTITAVTVGVGFPAYDGVTRVRLRNITTGAVVATIDLTDDEYYGEVLGLAYTWSAGDALIVGVPQIASAGSPGVDLVLQVVTA